ncbi:MAG TPA: flagellar basal body L-ring protein FlgH [Pirellulales bacterium]|nr:flagellar basal body L-ring protein FlgH [Pirellulales bacterium]
MKFIRRAAFATVAGLAMTQTLEAQAQSSSLYGSPERRRPLTLEGNSWFYIKPDEPPEIQLNDLITVIVDQKSQYINQAQLRRQQRTSVDADLQKWLQFKHFGLGLAPMASGSPEIEGLYNLQNQIQANLRQADGLQFRVGATVADIRPNGNLVIEAHGKVVWDNEITEQSLSGIIRRQDVLPNNTVLSEDVAELQLYVRQEGHIRDSWRRGWLWLFLDRHKPF